MVPVTRENVIRISNGDIIVKGDPGEIEKSVYEEGWCVTFNFRASEELEVEKSGPVGLFPPSISAKIKLPYSYFTEGNWYRLNI